MQLVLVIHDQQLVDAGMLGEKFVGPGDGVAAEFLLLDGVNLRAGGHRLGDFALGVTLLDDVAGEQADQFALVVHHRETC